MPHRNGAVCPLTLAASQVVGGFAFNLAWAGGWGKGRRLVPTHPLIAVGKINSSPLVKRVIGWTKREVAKFVRVLLNLEKKEFFLNVFVAMVAM